MEKKFDDLLKKIKAHKNLELEASKTFEFNLFSEGEWFIFMNEWDVDLKKDEQIKEQISFSDPQVNLSETAAILSNDIKEIKDNENVLELNPNSKIKILFIGDTYNGEGEDLLYKMISAMKLIPEEYKRIPLDSELELVDFDDSEYVNQPSYKKLIYLINHEAPLFVISLGAIVTNCLIGRREKMSTIHGKYFKLNAHDYDYQLMPLFHPEFLLINPNMKRTAWIDLQKVMQSLGKN